MEIVKTILKYRIIFSSYMLLIFGLILIYINFFYNMSNDKFTNWSFVNNAIMTSSTINIETIKKNINYKIVNLNVYKPVIEYRYIVGEKQFINNKFSNLSDHPVFYTKEKAQKYINSFLNKTLKIHYNPSDPSDSYLRINKQDTYIPTILGLILIIIGYIINENKNHELIQISSALGVIG